MKNYQKHYSNVLKCLEINKYNLFLYQYDININLIKVFSESTDKILNKGDNMSSEIMIKKIRAMFPEAEVSKDFFKRFKVVYKSKEGKVKEKYFDNYEKASFYSQMMNACHLDDYFQIKPYVVETRKGK